jgi:hypothetical protein
MFPVTALLRWLLTSRDLVVIDGAAISTALTCGVSFGISSLLTIPMTEQVGWLIEAPEDAYRPFIAVCAFAGLRVGEAAGLQIGNADFLRRTIHVQRQAQNNAGVVEVSSPRSGSERVVSMRLYVTGPTGQDRTWSIVRKPGVASLTSIVGDFVRGWLGAHVLYRGWLA